MSELGGNVCQHGTLDQGDKFTKTTEVTADCVGREHSKEMRLLAKNQTDNEPKEPDVPGTEETKPPFIMKKCETELKTHCAKKEKCEGEHKSKTFVMTKGQCTLNVKNKAESLPGCDDMEKNDDVIELLKELNESTFKTHDVQCGHWTTCQKMRRVLTMKQQDNESLAGCHKRFTSCVDVAESQWGMLVPTAAAKNERDEKTSRQICCLCFSCRSGLEEAWQIEN